MMISIDLNGHVGTDDTGGEELKGRFGIQERNAEGQKKDGNGQSANFS